MDKLPKSFTTVTPFSKAIAMALFVALPFIGFYLGMQYQKSTTQFKIVKIQAQPQEIANDKKVDSATQPISPSLSDSELYDMVDEFVGYKISRSGGKIFYVGTEFVGTELYAVTVGIEGSEGSTYFVGNDNGDWKVSSYLDNLWCPWLEMSNYEESLKPYLGIDECRKSG